jgi:hypothetical protein
MRLFAEIAAQREAENEESEELWDRFIESSQGALQRLSDPPSPTEFSPGFLAEVRRIIAEDRAEPPGFLAEVRRIIAEEPAELARGPR